MSVKLGIAPIAWSNDDMPELGGDTPLEQCLSEASEAGFSGIESGGKFPKKSKELIPLLEKYNLNLCSGWYGANLRKNSVKEEISKIQEQLKLFQDCKAPCIVFAEVSDSIAGDPDKSLSSRPQMDKEGWNEFCKKISEIFLQKSFHSSLFICGLLDKGFLGSPAIEFETSASTMHGALQS